MYKVAHLCLWGWHIGLLVLQDEDADQEEVEEYFVKYKNL